MPFYWGLTQLTRTDIIEDILHHALPHDVLVTVILIKWIFTVQISFKKQLDFESDPEIIL